MKNRIVFIVLLIGLIASCKVFSQNKLKPVEHKIIAEGTDSPIPELQIVCFNKYFNKDYLTADFRQKYNLDDKKLYKKKTLKSIPSIEKTRTPRVSNGFPFGDQNGNKSTKSRSEKHVGKHCAQSAAQVVSRDPWQPSK